MPRFTLAVLFALAAGACACAALAGGGGDDPQQQQPQQPVVYHSDVSLVRVDAQVLDRNNRAIAGLRVEDFVLRLNGQPQPIRNFAREDMPMDVLLLLDVSGSMRPHVQRIADATHDALNVLGPRDRVAIMVFDRATRVRMPFRDSRDDVVREMDHLLRQESFNGGTDITRALLDAARYIGREGRREARRAIVILTDDATERERDEAAVSRALEDADAVLSALIAPDAMRGRYPRGGGYPGGGGGGGWPGQGGPLGGIILGRRGPYGNGGGNRGPGGMPRTQSAGTSEIARRSGGDSMSVDGASALEDTLARLRQRYALHFNLPAGIQPGQERNIQVEFSDAARRRYPDAEIHYRRAYMAGGTDPGPTVVSERPTMRRRTASSSDEGTGDRPVSATAPAADSGAQPRGGWRHVDEPIDRSGPARTIEPGTTAAATTTTVASPTAAPAPATPAPASAPAQDQPKRGWRRVDEPVPAPKPKPADQQQQQQQ